MIDDAHGEFQKIIQGVSNDENFTVNSDDRGGGEGATESSAIQTVPTNLLRPADSPRLDGQYPAHIDLLAQTECALPPILVHRATMRVIDGMHRLEAAMVRGATEIAVRYFDGSQDEAFILAVRANTTHGLPLALADREAAAIRIAAVHPQWADRVIAEIVGLAASTVGTMRRRFAEELPSSASRVGRDGKVRPLSSLAGRRRACELITDRPQATLREVAKLAGISVGTARDVRERMRRGQDPVPEGALPTQRRSSSTRSAHPTPTPSQRPKQITQLDQLAILRSLQKDPSLRFTETGRLLLRCLDLHALGPDSWDKLVHAVPAHCAQAVAELANACADMWTKFAEKVADREWAPTQSSDE